MKCPIFSSYSSTMYTKLIYTDVTKTQVWGRSSLDSNFLPF